MLRELLIYTLNEAGYDQLTFFENGVDAWEYLEELSKDEATRLAQNVDLISTDTEMPKMNGHHLTDRVKKDSRLHELPVIIFSSLITNDLFHKGERVGANAQVSKPEIVRLVEHIDEL